MPSPSPMPRTWPSRPGARRLPYRFCRRERTRAVGSFDDLVDAGEHHRRDFETLQPPPRSARAETPAPAVPAAPQQAGGCRHRREQWRSAGQHCASPAPPRFRTPPDEPATRSPASYADAPVARGRDAAAPLPVALPSSPAQIASSGAQQPRKSLRHQRHRAYCALYTPSRIAPASAAPRVQAHAARA